MLLISSYSLGKADVNYRAGSKLPGNAYSSDAHSQTLRVSLTHCL